MSPKDLSKLAMPLSHGQARTVPSVGYGCWKVPKETCADLVEKVIRAGYRHIDGAADYGNEKQVGEGVRRAIRAGVCKREDLHLTSKLWGTFHKAEHVRMACEKTMVDMGVDYLDLYLIHFPIPLKYVPIETRYPPEWIHDTSAEKPGIVLAEVPVQETWRAMEDLVHAGLVRNIGVANFNCQLLRDLFSFAQIKPSVLQVELHPYLQQDNLLRYAQSMGMHVTAYSPMGHGLSYWNDQVSAFNEQVVKDIAKKYDTTPAQVILRWGLQRGCSVIPKTENDERIKKNIDLFNFELNEDDMKVMKGLNKNFRFNDPAVYTEKFFHKFVPIFD